MLDKNHHNFSTTYQMAMLLELMWSQAQAPHSGEELAQVQATGQEL
jgi:hypothetical protein